MRLFQSDREGSRRLRAASVGTGVLLVASLALAGCGREQPLTIGSCLNGPVQDNQGRRIAAVDCDKEHYGEVVGIYVATDGPFPGTQTLAAESKASCRAAFEDVVGLPASESVYDLLPLTPSEDSWTNSGDRQVLCVARSSTGEQLTGSVAGTHR